MPCLPGVQQMRALGITTVFDLRSDPEMQKYSSPIPTIEGVRIQHTPVFRNEDYSPESMARCVTAGPSALVIHSLPIEGLNCIQAALRRYSDGYYS